MKMSVSLFWGLLLILIGLSLIIKIVFNIDFPIIKILFAFLFIYLGIKILIGRDFSIFHHDDNGQTILFSEKNFSSLEDGKEYSVIFGGGKLDFRTIALPDSETVHCKINTIFGGTEIVLDQNTSVQIKANTAFAGSKMPDGNSSVFGTINYTTDSSSMKKPKVILETNTVFGGLHVKRR